MRKALLLFSLLLLTLLPQIASHTFARRVAITQMEKQWGGQVMIEKISLSWFREQRMDGLAWKPESKGLEYHFDQVICKSWWEPSKISLKGGEIALKKGKWALKLPKVEAKLKNGAIEMEQALLLLDDSIEVWVRGTIDPPNNQLDLILGIPGKSLSKLLKVKELDLDLVLEVPLSGRINRLSFEKITKKALLCYFQSVNH